MAPNDQFDPRASIQELPPQDNLLNPLNALNPRDDLETGAIIAAGLHVHIVLGPGSLEAVYQSALAVELAKRSISFQREVVLPIWYEDAFLDAGYRVGLRLW